MVFSSLSGNACNLELIQTVDVVSSPLRGISGEVIVKKFLTTFPMTFSRREQIFP